MSLYSKSRLIFHYESFILEITFHFMLNVLEIIFQYVYNDIGRREQNELK